MPTKEAMANAGELVGKARVQWHVEAKKAKNRKTKQEIGNKNLK